MINPKLFLWNEELETGIDIVDNQHKMFFKQTNRYLIKLAMGSLNKEIPELFSFLEHYLQSHFPAEETFLIDSHYPDLEDHKADHLQLKFKLMEAQNIFQSKSEDEAAEYLADFLQYWVNEHVLNADLKFTRYYNEQKKKQQEKERE